MKILVTGPADGYSGWSRACREYTLALDSVGYEVVPRYYKLNDDLEIKHPRIEELKNNSENNCDVIFHVGLPYHYNRHKKALNIGVFFTETLNFKYTSWPGKINLMDLAIVANKKAIEESKNSGVNIPVYNCPPPIKDLKTEKFEEVLGLKNEAYNDFLFYFIGDVSLRKNLPLIIKSFNTAFTPNMPVSLVLKISKYGENSENLRSKTINTLEEIKRGLRIRPINSYKKEIIITETLSDYNLNCLHKTCNCLLNVSSGEAFGFSVLDALSHGNITIASNVGISSEISPIIIDGQQIPCYAMSETFPDLMTSNETWLSPSPIELIQKMQFVYDNKEKYINKQNFNIIDNFSYESIGNKLKMIIENHLFLK